jgi:hypothetical protein
MTRTWIDGALIEIGDDDPETILLIAKTIEEMQDGHMIDRWEWELTQEQKERYIRTAAAVYHKLKGKGLITS